MKKKLKSLTQIFKEYEYYITSKYDIMIYHEGRELHIDYRMIRFFSKEIEVQYNRKIDSPYKYESILSDIQWKWHENWFETELKDFIGEKEFMI